MKIKILYACAILATMCQASFAQKIWSLDDCIQYALENNYTVRQKLLTMQSNDIQLQTTKYNILPEVAGSIGQNFDFGRAESVNAVIINNTQSSTSLGIGLNMPLFNGLINYYQRYSDEYNLKASLQDVNQAKEDLSLNITSYYLQVLLSKEILEVAKEQVKISEEQVKRLEIEVANGKTSESELYNAKSTLATDLVNVTKTNNDLILAKVDLAQLMNYNDYSAFEVEKPDEKNMTSFSTDSLKLAAIIENATTNRPEIIAANFRIEKNKYDVEVARSSYYPSLNLSASYGTGYYYAFNNDLALTNDPFGKQLNNNSREIVSLSMNIPIFSKFTTRNSIKQSEIQLQSQEIALEETKNTLTKAIYQAYTNANAAKDNYLASQEAVKATKIAYDYEQVKYESGASTSFDFSQAKNKYESAKSSEIQAKYEYLLRTKILEYYSKQYDE